MKILFCHNGNARHFTKGKTYEILRENDYNYTVIDDEGDNHCLTKKPDCDGRNFETFMTLKEVTDAK